MNHFTWSKRSSTPRDLVVSLDLVVRPLIEEAQTRRSLNSQSTTRSAHRRLILYHFDPTDHAGTIAASADRQLVAVGRSDPKQVEGWSPTSGFRSFACVVQNTIPIVDVTI